MKVNIYGCGLSGLTVAHELVEKGFQVEIFEKAPIGGGMARSFRYSNGVPTEHSWRGYGPFYKNVFDIMKRIPVKETCSREDFGTYYSIEEVKKHTTKDSLWTYYKGEVYDVTEFMGSHPGGSLILNAGGKDLEQVWEDLGYSWHMENPYVMKTLKKYKIGKLKEGFQSKTAYDNLNTDSLKFFLLDNSISEKKASIKIRDVPYLSYIFSKVLFSNKRRRDYYKISFDKLVKKKISKSSYRYLIDFIGGAGYGIDKQSLSYAHYVLFFNHNFNVLNFNFFNRKDFLWKVLNKPTSEGWIEPWISFLKNKGVKFNFNVSLERIKHDGKKIEYCVVNGTRVVAKEHIFALDPYSLNQILKRSNFPVLQPKIEKLSTVNNQISFRLGFRKKVKIPIKNTGLTFVEAPYNITTYFQEDHWCPGTNLGMDGKIKSLMSGTLITPYYPGVIYKKSGTSLTKQQLLEEIIEQIFMSKDFLNVVENKITKEDIIFKEIFSDWEEKNGRLVSKNVKWNNNTLNQEYRPLGNTKYSNMFLTGGHNLTTVDVWTMESTVESGKITSNMILEKYNKKKAYLYSHSEKNEIIKTIQKMDDFLYSVGLPNIVDVLFIIVIIYFLLRRL